MPGIIERNSNNLHDADTGELVGYRNPLTNKETRGLGTESLGGAFVFGSKDGFGRITSYTKGGTLFTVAYSNADAIYPTNFTIARADDGSLQRAGSVDADGYPTVIA